MRLLHCPGCGATVVLENTRCEACGRRIGFDPGARRTAEPGPDLVPCRHAATAACPWLVPAPGGPCPSCVLTRTRPADDDPAGLAALARTEAAKRRLVLQLLDLGLPLRDRGTDPERGLAFDLLSARGGPVTTGHAGGVVTIDLSEGYDPHREAVRVRLAEPYRTVLGHLRHEVGHYYWDLLVRDGGRTGAFRELFGDEREDYAAALQRHYDRDPVEAGDDPRYLSGYASSHPWEDWAETFAHYLHVTDVLDTAAAHGLAVAGRPVPAPGDDLDGMLRHWGPLAFALNEVSRSLDRGDLYPFVLTPPVVAKLRFVHEVVRGASVPA